MAPAPPAPPAPTPVPVACYTLMASVSPSGGGSISPSGGTYENGTAITLTAAPALGYRFDHWSGDAYSTSPTMTITMDANKNITAIFASIPTPAPNIETQMQGVSILGYYYMNYTKYLQAGDTIDGVVRLTGPVNPVDNSYQWQFQILGPGGESVKAVTADFRTTTSIPFHVVASYAGTYRIRVTHQSISTRTLIIDLTPTGWGYANLN